MISLAWLLYLFLTILPQSTCFISVSSLCLKNWGGGAVLCWPVVLHWLITDIFWQILVWGKKVIQWSQKTWSILLSWEDGVILQFYSNSFIWFKITQERDWKITSKYVLEAVLCFLLTAAYFFFFSNLTCFCKSQQGCLERNMSAIIYDRGVALSASISISWYLCALKWCTYSCLLEAYKWVIYDWIYAVSKKRVLLIFVSTSIYLE